MPTEPEITEALRSLVREYRPSMDKDVLHSWAGDVVSALSAALAAGAPGVKVKALEWVLEGDVWYVSSPLGTLRMWRADLSRCDNRHWWIGAPWETTFHHGDFEAAKAAAQADYEARILSALEPARPALVAEPAPAAFSGFAPVQQAAQSGEGE